MKDERQSPEIGTLPWFLSWDYKKRGISLAGIRFAPMGGGVYMITTKISVDFALPNIGSAVEAMQGDGATRRVVLTLRANGLRWEPPAGEDVVLAYRQPDGHKGIYDKLADGSPAITISGNVASVVLIPQMLAVPGDVQCQLIFNDSKLDRLTSFPFVLKVKKNDVAGAALVQDYVHLQWLEDKLEEYWNPAREQLGTAVASAQEAVSDANQALQEAGTAIECANEAAQTANQAAGKADISARKADSAVSRANSAAEIAEEAAGNAVNAANLAISAAGSANEQGQNAKDSAEAAAEAANHAETAAGFANTASDAANDAASRADTAAAGANAAKASADTAAAEANSAAEEATSAAAAAQAVVDGVVPEVNQLKDDLAYFNGKFALITPSSYGGFKNGYPEIDTAAHTMTFKRSSSIVSNLFDNGYKVLDTDMVVDYMAYTYATTVCIYYRKGPNVMIAADYNYEPYPNEILLAYFVKNNHFVYCSCPVIVDGNLYNLVNLDAAETNAKKNPFLRSIAHRGYSSAAPENTLAAIRSAKKVGFDAVEIDVRFSSDGVPILMHSATLDGTTDGTGNVADKTLEELKTLDAGSWFGEKFTGERIPTFEESVSLCKKLGLFVCVDIKIYELTTEQAEQLMNIVKKYGMRDFVSWISYRQENLDKFKNLYAKARLGVICDAISQEAIDIARTLKTNDNSVFLSAGYSSTYDESNVNLCINADIPLEVWTVDIPADIEALNPYISGITSNVYHAGNVMFDSCYD